MEEIFLTHDRCCRRVIIIIIFFVLQVFFSCDVVVSTVKNSYGCN